MKNISSKNSLKIKKQSTVETCLSVCLITLLKSKGIEIEDSAEINILVEGIKFIDLDYSTGHLVHICNNYGVEVEQYIDNQFYYNILSKLKYPKNLRLIYNKITKKFLQKMIDISPVVIYLDLYYLEKIYHYPHFVILTDLNEESATFLDPLIGKEVKMKTKLLIRSIQSLRNKLKICPKVIRII